jgi:opacity protein-like surface antigen
MKGRVFAVAIVALLGCTFAGTALAQVVWEGGFKGGVSGTSLKGATDFFASVTDGVNTLDLSGDIGDSRTGFAGGGFATAHFSDVFALRLELLYTQKGGTGPVNVMFNGSPAGTADVTFKADYIEIPVLAVASLPTAGKTKVNVFGGPSIGFKTGAKVKVEFQGESDEQDNSDGMESTDFGFAAGAGLSFATSPRVHLVADGRYTFGLSKVFTSGEDIKNGGYAFMAGISFTSGAP